MRFKKVMKDILFNIHYGVTFVALTAFIIAVLAIIMLRGMVLCLKRNK